MRQKFANFLAAPFVAGALFFLYLSWDVDPEWAPWIVPFVVMATLIYVFAPQINWWWYNRRPPVLPEGLRRMLEQFSPVYRRLDAAGKQRFRDRVALFMMGTDWTPMAWPEDTLPPDIQLALATQAVTLTFNRSQFLFDKFEKVIVYPYPFPSPEYDFVHASELHEEDGCLLFSADQLMRSFLQPNALYNIGMHEYAKAFRLTYAHESFPGLPEETIWDDLKTISQMSREHIEAVVGVPVTDPLPVAIHHYFLFPDPFRQTLPEVAKRFDLIFT